MTNSASPATWKAPLLLAVLVSVTLAVRLFRLGDASLWLDEAWTISLSLVPWDVLWISAHDPNPPLFFTVERLVLQFGDGEFLLRLPSAVFGALTVGVVAWTVWRIAGARAALAAGILLAFSFYNLEYSQEARAYQLVNLCIALASLGLVELWAAGAKAPAERRWIRLDRGLLLYGVALAAALYSHNTAVFFWAAAQLFFLGLYLDRPGERAALLRGWIVVNGLVFLAWTPWLLTTLEVLGGGEFGWLQQPSAADAFKNWVGVHGFAGVWLGQPWIDLALAVLAVLGLYRLRGDRALLGLFLGGLFASSVLIWAFGVLQPIFMTRTILWGSLFSAALVGVGVSQLARPLGLTAIAVILVLSGKSALSYFALNHAQNEDWRGAAEAFRSTAGDDDVLVFCSPAGSMPFFYYVRNVSPDWSVVGVHRESLALWTGEPSDQWFNSDVAWMTRQLSSLPRPEDRAGDSRLWMIVSHCTERADLAIQQQAASLGWSPGLVAQFSGVRVRQLRAPAPTTVPAR